MDFSIVEKNLKDRGYIVTIFETATEAVKYLDMHIDNQTVGFGGSVTLEQMKLFETLQMVLCQEKVQIKYALLMLSYPAKALALSSNAA